MSDTQKIERLLKALRRYRGAAQRLWIFAKNVEAAEKGLENDDEQFCTDDEEYD